MHVENESDDKGKRIMIWGDTYMQLAQFFFICTFLMQMTQLVIVYIRQWNKQFFFVVLLKLTIADKWYWKLLTCVIYIQIITYELLLFIERAHTKIANENLIFLSASDKSRDVIALKCTSNLNNFKKKFNRTDEKIKYNERWKLFIHLCV